MRVLPGDARRPWIAGPCRRRRTKDRVLGGTLAHWRPSRGRCRSRAPGRHGTARRSRARDRPDASGFSHDDEMLVEVPPRVAGPVGAGSPSGAGGRHGQASARAAPSLGLARPSIGARTRVIPAASRCPTSRRRRSVSRPHQPICPSRESALEPWPLHDKGPLRQSTDSDRHRRATADCRSRQAGPSAGDTRGRPETALRGTQPEKQSQRGSHARREAEKKREREPQGRRGREREVGTGSPWRCAPRRTP